MRNLLKKLIFFVCISSSLLMPGLSYGQAKVFDFNARCEQAYHQIMMMKTGEGQRILNEEIRSNPNNLIPYFLENYIDMFTLFFHENKAEYNTSFLNREKRIKLMQQGPKNSPFYLFTQAMIYEQWGIVKLKYEENISAMWDFRRAYLAAEENNKAFPDFSANKIIMGPMKAMIGTVPSSYRWITNILGFNNGSVNDGIALLKSYINDPGNDGGLFKDEACFYYAYMEFYIAHKPEAAMKFIRDQKLDIVNNALYAFMAANLALNDHEAGYGLQVLENMQKGPEYLKMPVLNYEFGTLKLYHMDLNGAIHYLDIFVNNFKGKFYIKDALSKLSWAYYLQGNMKEAENYRKLVLTRGNTVVDADKVALREAKSGQWSDPEILKARMLMNGGYFKEALQVLRQKKIEDYHKLINKIEYAYFLARIHDELGNEKEAVQLYEATIKAGADRPEYYAARSALQLGFIYEKRKDTAIALNYFRQCLNMNEKEYKSSLDQRAKAGINRLTIR
ncbi:MAG: tetratricopeptide repeat protein [Chitinophagaceae bacterium]|nr:MAG: tetratricopeptide repeat protein [Chitinophagaceae bacterium]